MVNETELDQATLDGIRRGSEAACRQVYERYSSRIYTLALRICQDESAAMDVLQDCLVQAFGRIDQFRGDYFWPWLRRIAVNLCLTYLRRQRRMPVLRDVSADLAGAEPNPGLEMDLEAALGQLPPQARTVVWLYDVEGYSHQEIARLFGRSISFSKTQLSRAHQSMRLWLTSEENSAPCQNGHPCQA